MKTRNLMIAIMAILGGAAASAQDTNLYWGDTHLHTNLSPDAYLLGNRSASPDTAYRYAKGYPVVHPYNRTKIRIGTPLDFLVVSEHAEYVGIIPLVLSGDPMFADSEVAQRGKAAADAGNPQAFFAEIIATANSGQPVEEFQADDVRATIWEQIVDSAEQHNEPGKFTAFIGWEWSSIPNGANLHRVVLMDEGKEEAMKFLPYSLFDSDRPEDLWNWLSKTSEEAGTDFVAIPHNQNISKGFMFPLADSDGNAITSEYATARMRWETVVETTQIKGDSETHPALSPNDEFANYETYDHTIESGDQEEMALFGDGFIGQLTAADIEILEASEKRLATAGDYTRSALIRGLAFEERIGINPYKFGMIGSTDSHTSMSSAESDNFWGKMALDSTPENTLDPTKVVVPPTSYGADMGAAGLAAIWATENTRKGLLDAFQRKETYATTGPRIELRFFGGFGFRDRDARARDVAAVGYSKGVPMGGDLIRDAKDRAPTFLIRAVKDPVHANLDRVQVVKGWIGEDGGPMEKVYDVAWAGGREPGDDGKLPPIGNTVNLDTANYSNSIGTAELATVWSDPDFDPGKRAFYYIRVLQIPTPRHTLYDAVALGQPHPEEFPPTIQERAYSSPIWYTP